MWTKLHAIDLKKNGQIREEHVSEKAEPKVLVVFHEEH